MSTILPDRAQRLQQLFKAALMHPPEERTAFLDAACVDDPRLRSDIDLLLQSDVTEHTGFQDEAELPTLNFDFDQYTEESLEGQQIGDYTILRPLGHGGMGEVYYALRNAPFKQYVALKVIRHGLNSRDLLQRFEMERQILASLSHPNIARLLDGGLTQGGVSFFVMEYVQGVPINEYCDTKRLTINQRLELFQAVCRAVHYAHQNLVVHRDLKPSNILVTKDGRVKLLDFGVAKLLNPALSHVSMPVTRTMVRMMTPEYASPEQVRGEPLTTASDVYALGVLLYELMTGHRPYQLQSSSPQEIERIVCEHNPERPSTRVIHDETILRHDGSTMTIAASSISAARSMTVERLQRGLKGDLDNIVMMALRKEVSRRYGSAEQLAADIERYRNGLPVEARSSTITYRTRKFVQRNKLGVAAACMIVLSLFAGLGAALWQANQARQERDRAQIEADKADQVSAFLEGLFDANDPARSLGEEITARQLLERGVTRAEGLSNQPEVQTAMLNVMGRAYRNLGQYQKARPLLEQALVQRRQLHGDNHTNVAQSMNNLAMVLRRLGEYEEAEALYRESLQTYKNLYGEESAHAAISMNNLALALRYKGDYQEAEELYRESMALRRVLYGEDSPVVSMSMNNLGSLLRLKGDYDAAEPLLRDAVARFRRSRGNEHPDVAMALNNLGLLLYDRGEYAAAEPHLREALNMRQMLLTDTHPRIATSLNNLALVLKAQDDYETADSLHRDALALQRASLSPNHPDLATTLKHLATLLKETSQYEAAEPLYSEALSVLRGRYGERHEEVQEVYQDLIDFYTAWDKPEQVTRYQSLMQRP